MWQPLWPASKISLLKFTPFPINWEALMVRTCLFINIHHLAQSRHHIKGPTPYVFEFRTF